MWEPQIPSSLAPAKVEYTLLDDNHFLGAGFELGQLHGYYTAEDLCHTVKVLPGLKKLRYLIPFSDVNETIQFLYAASNEHPGGFAAMGDDLEKFGVWPGTYDLCYRDGWLENFFLALERCGDWLEVSTPGVCRRRARAARPRGPAGRVLYGNDGMGPSDRRAAMLSCAGGRICFAAGGLAVFARRRVAQFFQQVL